MITIIFITTIILSIIISSLIKILLLFFLLFLLFLLLPSFLGALLQQLKSASSYHHRYSRLPSRINLLDYAVLLENRSLMMYLLDRGGDWHHCAGLLFHYSIQERDQELMDVLMKNKIQLSIDFIIDICLTIIHYQQEEIQRQLTNCANSNPNNNNNNTSNNNNNTNNDFLHFIRSLINYTGSSILYTPIPNNNSSSSSNNNNHSSPPSLSAINGLLAASIITGHYLFIEYFSSLGGYFIESGADWAKQNIQKSCWEKYQYSPCEQKYSNNYYYNTNKKNNKINREHQLLVKKALKKGRKLYRHTMGAYFMQSSIIDDISPIIMAYTDDYYPAKNHQFESTEEEINYYTIPLVEINSGVYERREQENQQRHIEDDDGDFYVITSLFD